jgi:hypothetical protein
MTEIGCVGSNSAFRRPTRLIAGQNTPCERKAGVDVLARAGAFGLDRSRHTPYRAINASDEFTRLFYFALVAASMARSNERPIFGA